MQEPVIASGRTTPKGAFARRFSAPVVLLALFIVAYGAFFSAYSLQRHATLNTFAADLSFIDQPMWNTLHGRFLERTLDAIQAPRVAEHFEPVLLPLSLIYLVWDDVRAILILQSLALALGALPVFWIARRAFKELGTRGEWVALAFSLAYLLSPSLQAANIADFHADPLIVTPLLLAFWYGAERRWRPMWGWAVVVMAGKENMPALTAMLGLFLIVFDPAFRQAWRGRGALGARLRKAFSGGAKQGLALFLVSVAWFLVATFLIVAPLARQYYGTAGPVYLSNRYTYNGVGGLVSDAMAALREPARLGYLGGLLGAVGWLAILAPEYLLLGLPILIANTFSNFPGQYSGEQHYSAPLVPIFIVAAIYGARRLQAFVERQIPGRLTPRATNATLVAALGAVWLVFWSGSAQIDRGWTPLARPFEWPAYTEHDATLSRLTAQIPADAAVSATSAVHAHLAHREKIYVYPELGEATYVLVDVAGVTDMQASDLKTSVETLTGAQGFGVVDAADGFLLLAKGAGRVEVPPDFKTFAQVKSASPQVPVQAQFGPGLQFLGYDVVDDARWRLTRFRLYFKRLSDQPLPADLVIRYTARDPSGALVDDSALRPVSALLWHPPAEWAQGETICLETAGWFLPRAFAPIVTVSSGGQTVRPELAPMTDDLSAILGSATIVPEVAPDNALRLPGLARRNGQLTLYEGPLYAIETADASFAGQDWTVRLREWSAPLSAPPGGQLTVLFYWQAARAASEDYNVFLHLRDVTGKDVALGDGPPTWFTPRPTSTWQTGSNGLAGIIDAHTIAIPKDVEPGQYELVVGWYDWQTGKRLPQSQGMSAQLTSGNGAGDEFVLGAVTVDPLAGPRPDAVCLAAKDACASKE